MGFNEQAALAKDAVFREKVRLAVVKAAVAIMAEPATAKGTRDEKRGQLATKVLSDGGLSLNDAFAWAVAQNAAITASSNDGDLEFTVNSVFDAVAGVVGKER